MKEKRKNCLNIGSVLSMPSSRILLGVAGVLACASGSFAKTPALDSAREAAIVRYANQYIGHPYGKHVLKGIVFVESNYGKYKIGDGSFGMAQLEVPTARYVADRYGLRLPQSDTAVEQMLVRDDLMNIRLAAAYLGLLEHEFGSLANAVVAYNMGPTEARSLLREGKRPPADYLNKVMAAAARSMRAEKAATQSRPFLEAVKDRLARLLDASEYMTIISLALQPAR
jgi:transglycosylase-like protein with SLT domain